MHLDIGASFSCSVESSRCCSTGITTDVLAGNVLNGTVTGDDALNPIRDRVHVGVIVREVTRIVCSTINKSLHVSVSADAGQKRQRNDQRRVAAKGTQVRHFGSARRRRERNENDCRSKEGGIKERKYGKGV